MSAHDLVYVSKLLRSNRAGRPDPQPIVKRFVSANTISESPDFLAPQPFLVREIPVSGGGGKSSNVIRAAFVGLSELSPQPPKGLKITDPVEAAKRVVPEARRRADLVIVLAHGKTDEVIRIAREVRGIDAVIAGTGDIFTPPMRFGETLVAFTAYEARFLGEIRFYRDREGKFTTKARFISLDPGVGDDPTAMKVAADVTDADIKALKANQSLLNEWIGRAHTNSKGNGQKEGAGGYASSIACAPCHSAQYFKWANDKHARATDALVLKQTESDVKCLACHASGLQTSGLLGNGETPKLLSVQCEQCHGPAATELENR